MIKISNKKLDVQDAISMVSDPGCGGLNVFIGTVRNQTKGRNVLKLEFEAYEPMAEKEMTKIVLEAKSKWGIKEMAIYHRTGLLEIGEIAVIIASSAPHRGDSFAACQYAIDTLKQTVPIWKKEIFEDGEVWVSAHP
jgi:molybdopterin synthase catalytic subunit